MRAPSKDWYSFLYLGRLSDGVLGGGVAFGERREFGLFQRHLDELIMDGSRDPVPHPTGCRRPIFECFRTATEVAVIPAIEGPARDAQPVQRAFCGQVRLLNQIDDLEL